MNFDFKAAFDAVLKHLCVIRDKACESIPLLQSILTQGSSHETPQYNQICNFDELAALLQDPNQNDDIFAACLVGDSNAAPIFIQYVRDEDSGVITYTNLSTNQPIDPTEFKPCPDVKWFSKCYQDADGNIVGDLFTCLRDGTVVSRTFVPLDGGAATPDLPDGLVPCETDGEVKHHKWKLIYNFLDNTGTDYRVNGELEITLSDGQQFIVNQPPTTPAWTGQQQLWLDEIIAGAANLGVTLNGELRFANTVGYTDPNNGFFFPPFPTGITSDKMSARFINFTMCFGDTYIEKARWRNVEDPENPTEWRELDLDFKESKTSRGWRCFKCDGVVSPMMWVNPTTGIVEPVPVADLPPEGCVVCAEEVFPPTPVSPSPQQEYIQGCDNGVVIDEDTGDLQAVVAQINYSVTPPVITYFVTDGDGGLLEYNNGDGLVGQLVDCASKKPITIKPPCEDCVPLGNLWGPVVDPALIGWKVSYWQPSALGGNAAPHGNASDIFTVSGDTLTHVNGDPDYTAIINSSDIATSSATFLNALGLTSNADTNGSDQILLEGYYNFTSAAQITDTNTNSGERGAVYIQQCCQGDLEKLFEKTTDTTGGAGSGVYSDLGTPQGLHKVVVGYSDFSAWMGHEASVSYDGGNTLEPFIPSGAKPIIDCVPVVKCKDSGAIVHAVTGELVEVTEESTWHKVECTKQYIAEDC